MFFAASSGSRQCLRCTLPARAPAAPHGQVDDLLTERIKEVLSSKEALGLVAQHVEHTVRA